MDGRIKNWKSTKVTVGIVFCEMVPFKDQDERALSGPEVRYLLWSLRGTLAAVYVKELQVGFLLCPNAAV